MRMGVFGGSFDPVHLGHLWIAETALEALGLEEVRWIPAAQSPLKSSQPCASGPQRLEMISLALAGASRHVVDDREIRRGDISYTVDTVSELQAEFPQSEILLILGSDSLASFPRWHRPRELLAAAIPAVVQRGGEAPIDFAVLEGLADPERIAQCREHVIPMPLIEVSSRELRSRIAEQRSIRFRTPRPVEAMIEAQQIYRAEASDERCDSVSG